jgi:hypothetical protein
MITIYQGETGGYLSVAGTSDLCRLIDNTHDTHTIPVLLNSGIVTIQKRDLSSYSAGIYSLVIANTVYDLHIRERH